MKDILWFLIISFFQCDVISVLEQNFYDILQENRTNFSLSLNPKWRLASDMYPGCHAMNSSNYRGVTDIIMNRALDSGSCKTGIWVGLVWFGFNYLYLAHNGFMLFIHPYTSRFFTDARVITIQMKYWCCIVLVLHSFWDIKYIINSSKLSDTFLHQ